MKYIKNSLLNLIIINIIFVFIFGQSLESTSSTSETIIVEAIASVPVALPEKSKEVEVRVYDFEIKGGSTPPFSQQKLSNKITPVTSELKTQKPKSGKAYLRINYTSSHQGGWYTVWKTRILLPGRPVSGSYWSRGPSDSPVGIYPTFRSVDENTWKSSEGSVKSSSWQQKKFSATVEKLIPYWINKAKNIAYPMEFTGFGINGGWGKASTESWFEIDDLRFICEVPVEMPCYVRILPHFDFKESEVQKVDLIVQGFDGAFNGTLGLRLISRNGIDLQNEEIDLGQVTTGDDGLARLQLDWQPPVPGRYIVDIVTTPAGGKSYAHNMELTVVSREVQAQGVTKWQVPDKKSDIKHSEYKNSEQTFDELIKKDFVVVSTDLFPGWLIKSTASEIALFNHIQEWGLSGPSSYAVPVKGKMKILNSKFELSGLRMNEGWMLAWFAGSGGWKQFDIPFLITFEKKPSKISGGENGLVMNFNNEAGYIVFMPLYGFYKPPQKGQVDFVSNAGFESKNIRTWEWSEGIPDEVVERARYWKSVSLNFPYHCYEDFSIDYDTESVIIRNKISFLNFKDEWDTKSIKLAPVPPALGVVKYGPPDTEPFPVKYSGKVKDTDMFTPYGPYMGIEGTDTVEMTFSGILKYVNQAEVAHNPLPDNPVCRNAVDWMRVASAEYDLGAPIDLDNFVWAIPAAGIPPKAVPYLQGEEKYRYSASLMRMFETVYINSNNYDTEKIGDKEFFIKYGPGIHYGAKGDAGKLSCHGIFSFWSYAYNTGDWQLLADRWPFIRDLMTQPATMTWKTMGREGIAEMGDEAPAALGYARIALALGEIEDYNYGCYMFAREILHHYIKQSAGRNYFLRNQPVYEWKQIKGMIFWDNVIGETAAWRISGRDYPVKGYTSMSGEKQFANRYVRFSSEDVARFHYDYLRPDVEKEMEMYRQKVVSNIKGMPELRMNQGAPHYLPSLIRLYSYFLGTGPDDLNAMASPVEGWVNSLDVASAAASAYIRNADGGPQIVSITPQLKGRSEFQIGIQRNEIEGWKMLVLPIRNTKEYWPTARWYDWKPPKAPQGQFDTGNHWAFGLVRAGTGSAVRPIDTFSENISWVTQISAASLDKWSDKIIKAYEEQSAAVWMACGVFENGAYETVQEKERIKNLGSSSKRKRESDNLKQTDRDRKFASVMEVEYPPEKLKGDLIFKQTYEGAIDQRNGNPTEARWYRVTGKDYYTEIRGGFVYGVIYAYTRVYSPKKQKLFVGLGHDRAFKMWINKKVVYESDRESSEGKKLLQRDAVIEKVILKKGWNTILVKTYREEWNIGFFLRFQTETEEPVADLIFNPLIEE